MSLIEEVLFSFSHYKLENLMGERSEDALRAKFDRKLLSQNLSRPIRSLLFFILFYLYLWLGVDPRLIYHGGGIITNFPVFFRGWAFFRQFLSYPGGLVEYLSALLSQFFYIGWAGAVVVTLQAWLICVCTDYFLKAINASRLRWVRYIPPILLLILYTQYTYNFVTTMALLAALFSVCLYLRITPRSKLSDLVIFPVLSVIVYTIAGGAYLLFAALCAIYELLFSRRRQKALVCLLSAAVIPYVGGVLVFDVSIIDAFSNLLPFSWKSLHHELPKTIAVTLYMLYLLLPLTTFGLGLWPILVKSRVKEKSHGKSSGPDPGILSRYAAKPVLRWTTESCLLFVIAASAVLLFHDYKRKILFEVDYYAYHRMWPEVLEASRHYPHNYFVVYAANRALYHTGRLGYDMFSYYQNPDSLLLTAKEHSKAYWRKFDTYMDLGRINIAEHLLTESLEIFGERPMILKRLALINMVKANIGAARIYLGALSKTLFYDDWANSYLNQLKLDPNLSTDDRIRQLRGLMVEKDCDFSLLNINVLSDLLEKNKQNQMAFEYMMALYLLTKQLDKLVQNLDRLDDFDYPEIPRLYEEAILLHSAYTGKPVNLKGRQVSWQTHQRTRDFSDIFRSLHRSDKKAIMPYGSNKVAAFDKLAKNYGDSYFFYFFYGLSGMKE